MGQTRRRRTALILDASLAAYAVVAGVIWVPRDAEVRGAVEVLMAPDAISCEDPAVVGRNPGCISVGAAMLRIGSHVTLAAYGLKGTVSPPDSSCDQ
jgi:hypothetical protein